MRKTRGSTSEQAREYRQAGHDNATVFALLLGLDKEYQNDSKQHYQEVRFNMIKDRAMTMLYKFLPEKQEFNQDILVYGDAMGKFGNWRDRKQSN